MLYSNTVIPNVQWSMSIILIVAIFTSCQLVTNRKLKRYVSEEFGYMETSEIAAAILQAK